LTGSPASQVAMVCIGPRDLRIGRLRSNRIELAVGPTIAISILLFQLICAMPVRTGDTTRPIRATALDGGGRRRMAGHTCDPTRRECQPDMWSRSTGKNTIGLRATALDMAATAGRVARSGKTTIIAYVWPHSTTGQLDVRWAGTANSIWKFLNQPITFESNRIGQPIRIWIESRSFAGP